MVWGVCRRLLGSHHDAEDVFQATFLVLARKAAAVWPRAAVANWLHGVAYRTALKARSLAARRTARERPLAELPERAVSGPAPWSDVPGLLDQELRRLPAQYRLAIVCCDLEGQTRAAVARHCCVPVGTLSGWLTRGRRLLAKRLTGRGVTLSAGGLAVVVPIALLSSTIQAASTSAVALGLISANVVALTESVLNAMFLTKLVYLNCFNLYPKLYSYACA